MLSWRFGFEVSEAEIMPYIYKVCTAHKKNESSFPMCISFSVQTKYPSSSLPCDMKDDVGLAASWWFILF